MIQESLDKPILEEVVQFYLDNKDKMCEAQNHSQNSLQFRSADSSFLQSSSEDSIVLSEGTEEDDSPVTVKKRKRKDSSKEIECMPYKKRSK